MRGSPHEQKLSIGKSLNFKRKNDEFDYALANPTFEYSDQLIIFEEATLASIAHGLPKSFREQLKLKNTQINTLL